MARSLIFRRARSAPHLPDSNIHLLVWPRFCVCFNDSSFLLHPSSFHTFSAIVVHGHGQFSGRGFLPISLGLIFHGHSSVRFQHMVESGATTTKRVSEPIYRMARYYCLREAKRICSVACDINKTGIAEHFHVFAAACVCLRSR